MTDAKSKNIIIVSSMYFYSDWTEEKKHEIDLDDIIGFRIYWRGDGWHVAVVTKIKKDEYQFVSHELSHFVYPNEIIKILSDKRCRVLAFINTHNSDNFIENVAKVLSEIKN